MALSIKGSELGLVMEGENPLVFFSFWKRFSLDATRGVSVLLRFLMDFAIIWTVRIKPQANAKTVRSHKTALKKGIEMLESKSKKLLCSKYVTLEK